MNDRMMESVGGDWLNVNEMISWRNLTLERRVAE